MITSSMANIPEATTTPNAPDESTKVNPGNFLLKI
jgi:hypothetical protein